MIFLLLLLGLVTEPPVLKDSTSSTAPLRASKSCQAAGMPRSIRHLRRFVLETTCAWQVSREVLLMKGVLDQDISPAELRQAMYPHRPTLDKLLRLLAMAPSLSFRHIRSEGLQQIPSSNDLLFPSRFCFLRTTIQFSISYCRISLKSSRFNNPWATFIHIAIAVLNAWDSRWRLDETILLTNIRIEKCSGGIKFR